MYTTLAILAFLCLLTYLFLVCSFFMGGLGRKLVRAGVVLGRFRGLES